jgi:AcrR family transcriptional regulator
MTTAETPVRARQQQSQERRQRILDAARDCFGELGFAGATVPAIAQRAGVSNGLLYQFFRDKEHLFEVVVDEIVRDWVRALVAFGPGLTPLAQLDAMFRRSVEFCRSHPLLPALLTKAQSLELERRNSPHLARIDAQRELVAGILREGIAAGEIRRDLEVPAAADIVCQLQNDYSTRAYRRDPRYPADAALIDAAARFMRDALRA